jgi:hypothetical protein
VTELLTASDVVAWLDERGDKLQQDSQDADAKGLKFVAQMYHDQAYEMHRAAGDLAVIVKSDSDALGVVDTSIGRGEPPF